MVSFKKESMHLLSIKEIPKANPLVTKENIKRYKG
jgi:hypothetical protein